MSVSVNTGKSVSVDTNAHEITVTFGGIPGPSGTNGTSYYTYIAYASDASGTGFTTTFNASLDYVAIKVSATEIESPQASDFTGLWKNYKGSTGSAGSMAWKGQWTTATLYHVNELVHHAKSGYGQSVYVCTSEHTSGASTEPETGGSWDTVWDLYSEGGANGTGAGDLLANGTVSLSADWDVGAHKITANQLASDVATGTAPLVVASTTKVSNLNADQLDGLDDTAFVKHSLATAANDFLAASGSGDFVKKTLAETQTLLNVNAYCIEFCIDGGGSAITTGVKPGLQVPVAGTITKYEMISNDATSGSISIDLWKDTHANAPPTDADSIVASAPCAISSSTKGSDSTLTGWTKTLAAGNWIVPNVDSCTSIKSCTLSIWVTRS